jgi:hypothetical protein
MAVNLQNIFNAITPENIKNIPVVQDAMNIFIEILESNSAISKDISKIYKSDNLYIKDALIQTYIKTLYLIFNTAQTNEVLKAKLLSNNLTKVPFNDSITTLVNDEYYTVAKTWSQKLGTELATKFTYGFAKYLQTGEYSSDFVMTEIKPFHFQIDGSVYKEMYESIVKPLSHPVGFCYDYNQVETETINEFFNINVNYNFKHIEVRCITGYNFSVFTPDTFDDNVKADFLTRINPITDSLFTEYDFYNQVTVYTGKIFDTFNSDLIDNNIYIGIKFKDGTYLQQYTNPISISYLNYSDYIQNNGKIIRNFTDQCSLFLDYSVSYDMVTTDTFSSALNLNISEYMNVTDTSILTDNLLMYQFSTIGYYLYTTDNYYNYTSDTFYLHTS